MGMVGNLVSTCLPALDDDRVDCLFSLSRACHRKDSEFNKSCVSVSLSLSSYLTMNKYIPIDFAA